MLQLQKVAAVATTHASPLSTAEDADHPKALCSGFESHTVQSSPKLQPSMRMLLLEMMLHAAWLQQGSQALIQQRYSESRTNSTHSWSSPVKLLQAELSVSVESTPRHLAHTILFLKIRRDPQWSPSRTLSWLRVDSTS